MTEAPVSPLRRRMIEDMTIRKLAPCTQESCIRAIKGFSAFIGASPDKASFEDLHRYQLHLVSKQADISLGCCEQQCPRSNSPISRPPIRKYPFGEQS
jgi:hypothetical protein